MTTNEKCILITIASVIIAAIFFIHANPDKIDGQETLHNVVVSQVRC